MHRSKWKRVLVGLVAVAIAASFSLELEYAYVPPGPSADPVLNLGRKTFYGQTFGNEVFFTDILGILDGPLTLPSFIKALVTLRGRGTENLRVQVARTATIGGTTYQKGEFVDTGLDLPRGAWVPLGMPLKLSRGRVKVGISCAACHATVDPRDRRVVEGAPNANLNAGLLLSLASNSVAYFPHGAGGLSEREVDAVLRRWPPGFFDATTDLTANPVQIPDVFTADEHPYGWTGFAAAGPFRGLTAFTNNFARDSDALTDTEASETLFGLGKEAYLETILRRAASPRFRYRPGAGLRPSDFFAQVDPTPGAPGVNEVVLPPTFPAASPVAPSGLFVGSPGYRVWEQANGLSAWQNSLRPPAMADVGARAGAVQGRAVFERAGCATCHAGGALTNNRVIPAPAIGTEPSHAGARKRSERRFAPPLAYPPSAPVPVPPGTAAIMTPTDGLDPAQLRLAWAHGGSPGGYKVPGLRGLAWTAPYLHDGGVAAGPDPTTQAGLTGTLLRGVAPDPRESLRALVDRRLRQRVIAANQAAPDLRDLHITGAGHAFWADRAAGFTAAEQEALLDYLLAPEGPGGLAPGAPAGRDPSPETGQ